MGQWLAKCFIRHTVKLYGKGDSLADITRFGMIVLAVPLDEMLNVTRELAKIVQPEQFVWDIASVKSHFIEEFEKLTCRKASVHPMFGPTAESANNQNIIIISDVGGKEEQEELRRIFVKAKISYKTVKEHDCAMAYVLCLPYFVNFAFEGIIKNKSDKLDNFNESDNSNSLEDISGHTFRSQMQIAKKILENEKLATDIIRLNPYSGSVLNELVKELTKQLVGFDKI